MCGLFSSGLIISFLQSNMTKKKKIKCCVGSFHGKLNVLHISNLKFKYVVKLCAKISISIIEEVYFLQNIKKIKKKYKNYIKTWIHTALKSYQHLTYISKYFM